MFKKIFLHFLSGRPFKGALTIACPDKSHTFGSPSAAPAAGEVSAAELRVNDQAFFRRVVLYGDTGFGEAFFLGEFETGDLKTLLLWFAQNRDRLPGFRDNSPVLSFLARAGVLLYLEHLLNRNTKTGSRKNIKAHYDVSNDFYALWLDGTMTYSAAVFADTEDLRTAQENKYRMIAEKAGLTPGDRVLEIGCGWGGFSLFAAKNFGCSLTITTISPAQYELAVERIKAAGLSDRIRLVATDYRDLTGTYDKIVSIEMMEALGYQYVPVFMKQCADRLAPGGHMVVQCITYPDEKFSFHLGNPNYIKKYIFPGGELLSVGQIKREAERNGLAVTSVEYIGQDYAKTLNAWRRNLVAAKAQVHALGFDEAFFRKWLFYFVYCEVGFETGYINDAQIVIKKP